MSRSFPAFALGLVVFALDQVSKWIVLKNLEWGRPVEVIPGFFNLTLISNTGAAWGIFQEYGFILTLLAIGALVFLCIVRRHFTYVGTVPRIAFGLLLGGIAGNLTDRLIHQHVIDFLSFYVGRYHWPAFNVADSAICIGVALYILDSFFKRNPEAQSNPSQS